MDDKFDCIIVGGGIAGLSAAMVLARADLRFLLIERGAFCGSKNVSGGVLWGIDLNTLVPEYWEEEGGFERFINHRRLTFLDETSSFSLDFKSSHFEETPYVGVTVLRAKFDHWLAGKVEEAIEKSAYPDESFVATEVLVTEIMKEDGKEVGIKAGDEVFFADTVILAEGVNNLLTRQIGLQEAYVPADHMLVGVKEVIRFDQDVLEERFQLNGKSGLTNEYVGFSCGGVEGGGFLYTNRDSVSIGLVLGMKDLGEKQKTPYDLLSTFKKHPAVADSIRGGEVLEYSAHAVSSGDIRLMPKEIFDDGILVAGEAANLLLNAGKAIQGMDYAMRSGILAAETVVEAKQKNDFSADVLKGYRERLEESYVLQDMRRFQGAVHLLHDPFLTGTLPDMACDFGRQFFTIDNEPTKTTRQMLRDTVRNHTSLWQVLKMGMKASRSL